MYRITVTLSVGETRIYLNADDATDIESVTSGSNVVLINPLRVNESGISHSGSAQSVS